VGAAEHVGRKSFQRSLVGQSNKRLGGQVEDVVRLDLGHEVLNGRQVGDVAMLVLAKDVLPQVRI
jgi:hypothetical protein